MAGAETIIVAGLLRALSSTLISKNTRDLFLQWGVDTKLLADLETEANSTEALFWTAKEMLITDDYINFEKWLRQVKSALLDTEDLFEEIYIDQLKKNKESTDDPHLKDIIMSRLKKAREVLKAKGNDVLLTIHPTKDTKATRMNDSVKKLKGLSTQESRLKLKEKNKHDEFKANNKCSSSGNLPHRIFRGSEDEKEIIRLLNSTEGNNDPLRVIAITGMPGIGKSTMASIVYNGYEIPRKAKTGFDVKAWVSVTDSFDSILIIKSVLEQVGGSNSGSSDPEVLNTSLKSALKNKKFLFVLDDVWSSVQQKWEEALHSIFSVAAKGSRIIVTTRDENISAILSPSRVSSHKMNGLSPEDACSLFQSCAFLNGNSAKHPGLKRIGEDIVGKCNGSPLAIKMIAKVLLNKGTDEEHWRRVLSDENTLNSQDHNIKGILWQSYYHLPRPIKRCFEYMSIFPKGYVFTMKMMTRLWLAEGLVYLREGCNRDDDEHEAQSYFKHLSANFFIEPRRGGRQGEFMMHDLIHDLAELLSDDTDISKDSINAVDVKFRRMRVIQDHGQLLKQVSDGRFEKLRTFLPDKGSFMTRHLFTDAVCKDLFSKFKLLRVLSLKKHNISVVPDSIRHMKLLRYLNLSSTNIKCLPSWICRLYSLQILKISHCPLLETLPKELCHLVNFQHLISKNVKFTKLPDGFGKMVSLRTIPSFAIYKGQSEKFSEFKTLGKLNGILDISGLNNVQEAEYVKNADFGNKKFLKKLVLNWQVGRRRDDKKILDAISPSLNLKGLTINGFGAKRLSKWIAEPRSDDSIWQPTHLRLQVEPRIIYGNLASLSIINCFYCNALPSLGSLPCLKNLNIKGLHKLESLDKDFYGKNGKPFPVLQMMTISRMLILKSWYFPTRPIKGFPSVKQLMIDTCPRLTQIPSFRHFPSLTWFHFLRCAKLGRLASIGRLNHLKSATFCKLDSLASLDNKFYDRGCKYYPNLEKLHILDMCLLKEWCLPGGGWGSFCSLTRLQLESCPQLTDIPYCFPKLITLDIAYCDNLIRLKMPGSEEEEGSSGSSSTTYGNSLRDISIAKCAKLEAIPTSFDKLTSVYISSCESLNSAPHLQDVRVLTLHNVPFGAFRTREPVKNAVLKCLEVKCSSGNAIVNLLCEGTGFLKCFTSLKFLTIKVSTVSDRSTVSTNDERSNRGEEHENVMLHDDVGVPHRLNDSEEDNDSEDGCDAMITGDDDGVEEHEDVMLHDDVGVQRKLNGSEEDNDSESEDNGVEEDDYFEVPHWWSHSNEDYDLEDDDKSLMTGDDDMVEVGSVVSLPPLLEYLESFGDINIKVLADVVNLVSLKQLDIIDCGAPEPFSAVELPPHLECLNITNCNALRTIPEKFFSACRTQLEGLHLLQCPNLAGLPGILLALESVQNLSIERCDVLQGFPTNIRLRLQSLSSLRISQCYELKSLPEGFHNIPTLRKLHLSYCENLEPPEGGFPSKIVRLVVWNCAKMDPVQKMGLSKLTTLQELELDTFPETSTLDCCIPESVESIKINNFFHLGSVTDMLKPLKQLKHFDMTRCPLITQSTIKTLSKKYKRIRISLAN